MTKQNGIWRRRAFLKAMSLGAGVASVGPMILIPRYGQATPAFGAVKHLFVINTDGGMRSTCLFNSNVDARWNPPEISGVQSGQDGTEWGVGGVFSGSAHSTASVGDIPSVPQFSASVGVLGTVDHTPGSEKADGTHDTAKLRMATGAPDGKVGLLTRIYRDHPLYQGSGVETNLPPVVISQAKLFGIGSGEWGKFRPVTVGSFRDFRSGGGSLGLEQPDWARDFETGVDQRHLDWRSSRHRGAVEGLIDAKRQARTFRPIFTDPLLAIDDEPAAAAHGVSNAQLREMLGDSNFGGDVALGLRFAGFGAPAIAIGHGGWDFHSGELDGFAPLASEFGRVYAGLRHALVTMQHPDGGSFWDHSLVVVVSEFGRDNVEATGFNSGNGSDHVGTACCRFQALPFMGGAVTQGGRLFGATHPTTMLPESGEPVFGSIAVLATLLDVLGIDPTDHFPDAPLDTLFA